MASVKDVSRGVRDGNLADCLDPALSLGRLTGLLPFERTPCGFRVSKCGVLRAVLTTTSYLACTCVLMVCTFWKGFRDALNFFAGEFVNSVSLCVIAFTAHVVIFWELLFIALSWRRTQAVLIQFLSMRIPEGTVLAVRRKLWKDTARLCALTVLILGCMTTPVLTSRIYHLSWQIVICAYFVLTDVIICWLVKCLKYYLQYLNSSVSKSLEENNFGGLVDLQAEHGRACVLFEDTNACFEWNYVARVAQAFALSVSALVQLVNFGLKQPEVFGGLGLALAFSTPLLSAFVRLATACHFATCFEVEVNATARILSTHRKSCCSSEEKADIQGFLQQVETTKPRITARGFFEISKGLILQVLGHVGTYVVVFIQFTQTSPSTSFVYCNATGNVKPEQ